MTGAEIAMCFLLVANRAVFVTHSVFLFHSHAKNNFVAKQKKTQIKSDGNSKMIASEITKQHEINWSKKKIFDAIRAQCVIIPYFIFCWTVVLSFTCLYDQSRAKKKFNLKNGKCDSDSMIIRKMAVKTIIHEMRTQNDTK